MPVCFRPRDEKLGYLKVPPHPAQLQFGGLGASPGLRGAHSPHLQGPAEASLSLCPGCAAPGWAWCW